MGAILAAIDRLKAIIRELERLGTEPAGSDHDIISGLDAASVGTGTDYQVLLRPLRPGEVPLEELERAVAERTAELDRVWRNSRDLLVIIEADGVFRAVNPAWTAILGHEPAEIVGRNVLDFILPEDAAASRAAAGPELMPTSRRCAAGQGAVIALSRR